MADVLPSDTIPSAVSDQMFVPLRLFRTTVRISRLLKNRRIFQFLVFS
jgi:hypothetical protein